MHKEECQREKGTANHDPANGGYLQMDWRADSRTQDDAGGTGISQDELAEAIKATANTISRWETATYKPSVMDLEKLAGFFGVPITAFFPEIQLSSRISALLTAASGRMRKILRK